MADAAAFIPVSLTGVDVNRPLPVDILNARGMLLLPKGQALDSLERQLALPYRAAADGEPVEGRLTRRLDLLSGRFALLENAHEFTLVPWRDALDRRVGQTMSGMVVGGDIDWRFGRGRGGPGIS